jgi:hypothetical protein
MEKYKVVKKIVRKGYPVNSKYYAEAHEEASNTEKKMFPKGYKELKKISKKVPQGQMIGWHDKKGHAEVAKIVPKKLRREVYVHEVPLELRDQKRLTKEKSKRKK